jgi:hypothetical protein
MLAAARSERKLMTTQLIPTIDMLDAAWFTNTHGRR